MGTETKITSQMLVIVGNELVKLNNPLMGTETSKALKSFTMFV